MDPQVIAVEEYWIDRFEVTNGQYLRFVEATRRTPPASWPEGNPRPDTLEHPVTGITRADAEAYAHWIGKELPTVPQWMRAFHGEEPTLFPWGDAWEPDRANTAENVRHQDHIWPITETPRDISRFGVVNLEGNASELTRDTFLVGGVVQAIVKGGSGDRPGRVAGIGPLREFMPLDKSAPNVGFRCVYEPKSRRVP